MADLSQYFQGKAKKKWKRSRGAQVRTPNMKSEHWHYTALFNIIMSRRNIWLVVLLGMGADVLIM
jgi:hypothetical protein